MPYIIYRTKNIIILYRTKNLIIVIIFELKNILTLISHKLGTETNSQNIFPKKSSKNREDY